jgi:hypothetical protein
MAAPAAPRESVDQALRDLDLPALRQICVILTGLSALFLGLPITRAWMVPLPPPSLSDPAPSLDLVFSALLLGQGLAFAGSFWVQRAWRRWSLRSAWLLRYALCELVCMLGALGFYAAHLQGLLTQAPRVWLLGLLPLLALAWMLWRWPDEALLRKIFSRS